MTDKEESEVVLDSKTIDVVGSDEIDRHKVAQPTPPHSMDEETSVKDELEKITKDISNLRKRIEEINSNINAKFQDLKELFALIEPNKSGKTVELSRNKGQLSVLTTIPPPPLPSRAAKLSGYPTFTFVPPMMKPPPVFPRKTQLTKPAVHCTYCDKMGHTQQNCFQKIRRQEILDYTKPMTKIDSDIWSQKRICFLCEVFSQAPVSRDHLFKGVKGNMIRETCPEITNQDNLTQVYDKLTQKKVCLSCLRAVEGDKGHTFGQHCAIGSMFAKHLENSRAPWQCQAEGCPNRVMLCKTHKDRNLGAASRLRIGWPTTIKNSFVFMTWVEEVEEKTTN